MKTKTKLLVVLTSIIYANIFGQFGSQQVISTSADGAWSVYAADIDGDGFIDTLSTAYDGDEVAWYKNDGQGNFGAKQLIGNGLNQAVSVRAADIDGDGDLDVIAGSSLHHKIVWYENLNGQGSFSFEQEITVSVEGLFSIHTADVDNDGFIDILSASQTDDKIAWYRNLSGSSFSSQSIISFAVDAPRSIYTADIDGDGDLDVLSASATDGKIAWYENTNGGGNFGAQQTIATNASGASSVIATDIDGDGDMDVLSASAFDDKVAWYENTNGEGSFGTQQIINTNADGAVSVFAADLDGDGDVDVLSASILDDKIVWYENTDGQGSFTAETITTNADGAVSVFAAYIDGDNKIDVLSASSFDNKIAWYQNLGTLSVNQNTLLNISIYPNPIKDMLEINAEETITKVSVFNQLGQEVKSIMPFLSNFTIDLRALTSGIYILRIEVNNKISSKKIIKM